MTVTKYYKNSFICVCAYMSVYMSMYVCRDRLVYIYRQEEVMGDLLYHLDSNTGSLPEPGIHVFLVKLEVSHLQRSFSFHPYWKWRY